MIAALRTPLEKKQPSAATRSPGAGHHHPMAQAQQAYGNQAVLRVRNYNPPAAIQPKLTVSSRM